MTITDPFIKAARAEAERRNPSNTPNGLARADNAISRRDFTDGASWARDHIAAQEPTGEEVEAAARVLNERGWTCDGGLHEPGNYDECGRCEAACLNLARAALRGVRATRRDEETP